MCSRVGTFYIDSECRATRKRLQSELLPLVSSQPSPLPRSKARSTVLNIISSFLLTSDILIFIHFKYVPESVHFTLTQNAGLLENDSKANFYLSCPVNHLRYLVQKLVRQHDRPYTVIHFRASRQTNRTLLETTNIWNIWLVTENSWFGEYAHRCHEKCAIWFATNCPHGCSTHAQGGSVPSKRNDIAVRIPLLGDANYMLNCWLCCSVQLRHY